MPSSWSYGSFHPNSRFFNQVLNQIQVRNLQKTIHIIIIIQDNQYNKPPRPAATVPKEKRVVPEDYYRVLKERKIAEKGSKQLVSARAKVESIIQRESLSEVEGKPSSPGKFGLPYWLSLIDPEMDDEEAIQFIELPLETMYLIDKVVRQKAKAGPIGIDNSEFINLEIEEEYK